jgi:hypothetical protein
MKMNVTSAYLRHARCVRNLILVTSSAQVARFGRTWLCKYNNCIEGDEIRMTKLTLGVAEVAEEKEREKSVARVRNGSAS